MEVEGEKGFPVAAPASLYPLSHPLLPENPSRRHCIITDVFLKVELIQMGSRMPTSTGVPP
jgi:hypothetical protein